MFLLTVLKINNINCQGGTNIKKCEYNEEVFQVQQQFEQNIYRADDNILIQGNNDMRSKIWTIENNSDERQNFNDQMITMQVFNDEIDIIQLIQGTCFYDNQSQDTNIKVKIVTKAMDNNLSKLLKSSTFNTNDVAVVDVMFKIALAVKKLHDNNFLHLNLNINNISFYDNQYIPVLDGLEYSMPTFRNRTFQLNSDKSIAPEILQDQIYKKQNKNPLFQIDYTKSADIYSLCIIFETILNNLQSKQKNNYKNFKKFLLKGKQKDFKKRPSINEIINEFYFLFSIIFSSDFNQLEEYMSQEYKFFKSLKSNYKWTTQQIKQQQSKYDKRFMIYSYLSQGEEIIKDKELIQDIQIKIEQYCKININKDVQTTSEYVFENNNQQMYNLRLNIQLMLQ